MTGGASGVGAATDRATGDTSVAPAAAAIGDVSQNDDAEWAHLLGVDGGMATLRLR